MNKPVTFNIYPQKGRKEFFKVFIFEHKAEMVEFVAHQVRTNNPAHSDSIRRDLKRGKLDFEGIASFWGKCRWRYPNRVGQVCFHKDLIGVGIVSHEMAHAALYWVTRNNKKKSVSVLDEAADERLADTQGRLNVQFWNLFYDKFPDGKAKF